MYDRDHLRELGTLELLIMRGFPINGRSSSGDCATSGNSPLFEASSRGNVDIVKLLILQRADLNLKSAAGTTALGVSKNSEITRYLLEARATF